MKTINVEQANAVLNTINGAFEYEIENAKALGKGVNLDFIEKMINAKLEQIKNNK